MSNRMKVVPVRKGDVIYLDVYRKKEVFRIPHEFNNRNVSDMIYRVYIKLYDQYKTKDYPMWKTKIIKKL